jgi:hypothetical protein
MSIRWRWIPSNRCQSGSPRVRGWCLPPRPASVPAPTLTIDLARSAPCAVRQVTRSSGGRPCRRPLIRSSGSCQSYLARTVASSARSTLARSSSSRESPTNPSPSREGSPSRRASPRPSSRSDRGPSVRPRRSGPRRDSGRRPPGSGPVGSHPASDLSDRLAGVVAEAGHVLEVRFPPVPVGPDGRIGLGRDGNMIRRL